MTDTTGAKPIEETDPRYLAPFLAGMHAARMALVRHGWQSEKLLTVAEAVRVIDETRRVEIAFFTALATNGNADITGGLTPLVEGIPEGFRNLDPNSDGLAPEVKP